VHATMTPSEPDHSSNIEELFREKSLTGLYFATWHAQFPWRQILPSVIITLTMAAYLWFGAPSRGEVALQVRSLASTGFQFSSAMLGFLIAGFTIFATTTKPSLFRQLLATKHEPTGHSQLKWTFLIFIHVFAHFIGFLFFTMLIITFGASAGPVETLVKALEVPGCPVGLIVASTGLLTLMWWQVYLIVLLGVFVFNVYQAVAVMIVVEDDELTN